MLLEICNKEGNENQPSRRWSQMWTEGGTTVDKMLEFLQHILDDIGHATPGNIYCFTMDNLNALKNPAVTALILSYGHCLCFRAPYYVVDGPIEYASNSLQCLIRQILYTIKDGPSLINTVNQSIAALINTVN